MQIVCKELTLVNIKASNSEDVIRQVGKVLYDSGFVKDTYVDAVVEREKIYPTGLQLKDIGIAMPHTDSEHVHKSGICIAALTNPITFEHMGMPETKVEAEIIFMMSILDPGEHIDNLKKLLDVFGSEDVVREFKAAKTQEELYSVAAKYIYL